MLMKGFIGMVAGSQAMVADAMYSAKDVVTSLMVIVGMAVSEKPLDREHPYGHGKVEFILSLFVSVVFMIVTGYLLIHAISTLLDEELHRVPHLIALWAALISIGVNVAMYFYTRCVAIEVNSPMVRTLSKHHHADATASGAVVIGILGSHYMNMPWLDTLVALFETLHLMYLGFDVFSDAVKGLMDRSLEQTDREQMAGVIAKVGGVEQLKQLRTRLVGQEIFADIIIAVDAELSVSEAYKIIEAVKAAIFRRFVHIGSLQVSAEASDKDTEKMAEIVSRWKEKGDFVIETEPEA